jgi:hypothetical protein
MYVAAAENTHGESHGSRVIYARVLLVLERTGRPWKVYHGQNRGEQAKFPRGMCIQISEATRRR